MNINWYPGHMAKTKRQIIEDLRLIDVIIEILDSRIPIASRNPDIKEITKNKKKIILLNKCDLADETANKKWVEELSKEAPTLLTDSNSGKGIDKVTKLIDKIMEEEKARQAARGRINKTIRVMILGIPNVGKSSFINRIAKKTAMEVGNRPGVTRQKQWIRISKTQELLDTPGVLWPKFENPEVGFNLALTGAIKDNILPLEDVLKYGIQLLKRKYPGALEKRYEVTEDEEDYLLKLGKTKKLYTNSEIDYNRVCMLILNDLRNGYLGQITLDEF